MSDSELRISSSGVAEVAQARSPSQWHFKAQSDILKSGYIIWNRVEFFTRCVPMYAHQPHSPVSSLPILVIMNPSKPVSSILQAERHPPPLQSTPGQQDDLRNVQNAWSLQPQPSPPNHYCLPWHKSVNSPEARTVHIATQL